MSVQLVKRWKKKVRRDLWEEMEREVSVRRSIVCPRSPYSTTNTGYTTSSKSSFLTTSASISKHPTVSLLTHSIKAPEYRIYITTIGSSWSDAKKWVKSGMYFLRKASDVGRRSKKLCLDRVKAKMGAVSVWDDRSIRRSRTTVGVYFM